MKLKGVLFALFICAAVTAGTGTALEPPALPRNLGRSELDDEFADIRPFVRSSTLTPANAAKRLLGVSHQVKKLQHTLLNNLFRLKDYIVFHRMASMREYETSRALSRQSEASADSLMRSTSNPFAEPPGGLNSNAGPKPPQDSNVDPNLPKPNASQEVPNPEAKKEAEGKKRALSQRSGALFEGVDQPLLHDYGAIGPDEAHFGGLSAPHFGAQLLARDFPPSGAPQRNHE